MKLTLKSSGRVVDVPDDMTPDEAAAFEADLEAREPGGVLAATKRVITSGASVGEAEREAGIAQAETEFGGKFERTKTGALAEGMPGTAWEQFKARFDIARSYPKMEPTLKKLLDKFPGERFEPTETAPGQVGIRWLADKTSNTWRLIDSPEQATWLDALADIPGHLFDETTLGSLLLGFTSAQSAVPIRMAAQFVGAGTGEALKLSIEQARGFSETTQSIIQEAVTTGAFAAGGEFLFAPFQSVTKIGTKRGFLRMERFPKQAEALRSVSRMASEARQSRDIATGRIAELRDELKFARTGPGLRPGRPTAEIEADIAYWNDLRDLALSAEGVYISPGQLHPGLGRLENAAVATSLTAQEVRNKQGAALLSALRLYETRFGQVAKMDDATLTAVANDISIGYMKGLKELGFRNVYPADFDTALKDARGTLNRTLGEMRKRFYDDAYTSGKTGKWDLNRRPDPEAVKFAEAAREPTETAKMGAVDYAHMLKRGHVLEREPELDIAASLTADIPIFKPESGIKIDKLRGELKNVVDALTDPKLKHELVAHGDREVLEKLQALRTKLFDIKNAKVEGVNTDVNRKAGFLWSKLSYAIDNPIEADPDFLRLWKRATSMNKTYHEIVEIGSLVEVAKSTEAGKLALDFVKPGMKQTLDTVKALSTPEQWADIQNGYRSILANDIQGVFREFAKFNPEPRGRTTLDSIIPAAEQQLWKHASAEATELEKPLRTMIDHVDTVENIAGKWIAAQDAAKLGRLVAAAGGPEKPFSRYLGLAISKHIADKNTVTLEGRKQLNSQGAAKLIQEFETAGVFRAVFTPAEAKEIGENGLLLSYMKTGMDFGGSLAGTEAARKALPKLVGDLSRTALRILSGGQDLWRNYVVGTGIMSKGASRIWLGTGRLPGATEKAAYLAVRTLPSAVAEFRGDIEAWAETGAGTGFNAIVEAAGRIANSGAEYMFDVFKPPEVEE